MRDRILLWKDDNHEPSVWINKHFMGSDFITVIESALNEKSNSENSSEILEIYPWDFEVDDESLEDGEADILFDWFQDCPDITDKQWEYIFNREWRKLGKTL
jgi:hypothetical protein